MVDYGQVEGKRIRELEAALQAWEKDRQRLIAERDEAVELLRRHGEGALYSSEAREFLSRIGAGK
jgi:hypothetical protein